MANKTLGLDIKVNGKLDPSVQKSFAKLGAMATKVAGKAKMQEISKAVNTVGAGAQKAMLAIGAMGAAAAVAGVAFANSAIEAAKASIEAETKLGAVLKNNYELQKKGPKAYLDAQKALVGVAAGLQKVGVIEDDTLVAGFQQLATFQLQDKQITMLSGGFADLLAQQKGLNATSEDAVAIGNMIGKVMEGNVGALRRVGISFTAAQEKAIKLGDKTQRAAAIAEVLRDNVGGVNKALAATDQGKMQNVTNNIGDMKEEIGKKLLPVISKLYEKLLPFADKITQDLLPKLENANWDKAVNGLISALESGYNIASKVFGFLTTHGTLVKAALIAITVAMVGLSAVMLVFNIIALANPMVWIVLGIVAAVALLAGGIYYMWNRFEWFRNAMYAAFEGIKFVISSIYTFLKPAFDGIMMIFSGLIDFIVGVFTGNWGKAFEGLGKIVTGVFGGLSGVLKNMLNGIIGGVNLLILGANAVGSKLGIKIPMIPFLASGAIVSAPTLAMVGEAGPESVVPHNNKPRSRALALNAAAATGLNVGGGTVLNITFAPVYNGGSDVKAQARESFEEFKRMLETYVAEKERVSYA